MSASPGSRLSDDLYSLYLAGLGWLILPFYGDRLADVLPSDFDSIDSGINIGAALLIVAAAWSGYRGSPVMVSRAGVIHELVSAASKRAMLYPRFLRQLVARCAIVAIGASVLLAMSMPGEYELSDSVTISFIGVLVASLTVSQAMIWHLIFETENGRTLWFVAGAILAPLVAVGCVAGDVSFFEAPGMLSLVGVALVSIGLALYGLEWSPVDRLWGRARALETMRSSMQTVDFQQMLLDVRTTTDRPRTSGRALAKPWMPTPIWRQITAIQHGLSGQLVRLLVSGGLIVALLIWSDPRHGVVALAIAGAVAMIGFDLAIPIAATADQLPFLVHYRGGSARVLQGQMFTAVLIAMIIGGVVTSGTWASSSKVAAGTLILFFIGTLAALMQARIGSPDVAKWSTSLGAGAPGPILWARALSGPILLLIATISVSHQYFRPDEFAGSWMQLTALVAFSLAIVTMHPLEKSLR